MPAQKPLASGLSLLLHHALSPPLPPFASRQTSYTLLKNCTGTENLKLGKTIHAHLIKSLQHDIIQTNHLINLYVKCQELHLAQRLFDIMPQRNAVSFGALMAGYLHSGSALETLSLLKSMSFSDSSVRLNEYVFTMALASCSDVQAIEEGRQCHAYVLKSGLVLHAYVKNTLLDMYSRCSGVEDAVRVFKTVSGFDVFSFNAMVNAYLAHGHLSEALDVLRCMAKEVGRWDHVTYVTVLGVCSDAKDLRLGWQLHGQIHKRGIQFSVYVGSAIIDMYGKCGEISSARCAFEGLGGKNVVSWTSVMAVHVQNGCFEEALKLFLEMEVNGVQPNEFTYAVALNSCAGLSALRNGDTLNAHAEKSGHKSYLVVGNALINMYAKSGGIEDAQRVFMGMIHRNIISWNSIITGYSHNGLAREALKAFGNMLIEGEVPSHVTFVGVLSACAHLGLVDEGFYYLDCFMRELGIDPNVEHHTCIVGLLCRAGQLDRAESYMRYTPAEWDIISWRTLLSACQVFNNFGLGQRVAEHILQLDPDDVGTHILLSNMYAKAKRWDGVVKVRKLMRGRDIKKEPGVSWIQVRNETHIFASEDKRHPAMKQICEKVAELLAQIKLIGYIPNIASVLHDVEDEHKEEYLSYHSEKLAIAFGLINIPLGAPILIIKNLRMCDDCYTAVKLISIVTSRKIIVRDANRFHRFEAGICSCNDYW